MRFLIVATDNFFLFWGLMSNLLIFHLCHLDISQYYGMYLDEGHNLVPQIINSINFKITFQSASHFSMAVQPCLS